MSRPEANAKVPPMPTAVTVVAATAAAITGVRHRLRDGRGRTWSGY